MYKICAILIILSLIVLVILHLKRCIIYFPGRTTEEKFNKFKQKLISLTGSEDDVNERNIQTRDRFEINTMHIKNPSNNKCIIIFHGNAGTIATRYDIIKFMYNFCSVVIFDYRTYGKSTGVRTDLCSTSLCADALAVWNYTVKDLGYAPNNIVLIGESLGTSVATWLASHLSEDLNSAEYPAGLVLNSPFFSLSSITESKLKNMNYGLLHKILIPFLREYTTNQWIQSVSHRIKIIVAHSQFDEVIPYREAVKLFFTIRDRPNSLFININGTHNNIGLTDEYIYCIAELINNETTSEQSTS